MPYVNGVYMGAPGTAVTVNDSNFVGGSGITGLGTILIGPASDGEPNTLLPISTPQQAISLLKGGDLLQGVLNAYAGASLYGRGLNNFSVIRVDEATQGTSVIDGTSASAALNLTTTSYGLPANSAKWKVEAGTTSGYKVSQGSDFVGPGGQTYPTQTQDNLGLNVLSIYYSGGGTTPTATASDTTFEVSDSTGTLITVTLTASLTVQQLVNQLNQTTGVNATLLDPNAGDTTLNLFDSVSATALGTTAGAATTFTANVTAVARWFNEQQTYFTAVRAANPADLATASSYTYVSNATETAATNTDWQNAYTTAQSANNVFLIAPVSSSYSMWAMNDAHCKLMESLGQPRRGYMGDTTGKTESEEATQVALINSNRSSVVWPEQKGYDYNGNSTMFAPYLYACKVMGMRAVRAVDEALTHQSVGSSGMGQQVPASTVPTALSDGICLLHPDSSGNVVVAQDRTTWLQNTAYDKVENSTGLVADSVITDLNNVLATYVGQPVNQVTVSGAQAAILSRLKKYYERGWIAAEPKSTDVSLSASGDKITGSASIAFAVPTNYIVVSLSAVAANVSA